MSLEILLLWRLGNQEGALEKFKLWFEAGRKQDRNHIPDSYFFGEIQRFDLEF
jgi:hypothetical protein